MEDLFVDLKDGILLIKLLENLTKKKVAGFTGKTPKTEAHKIVNLDLAFKFMQAENIKMVGVGKGGYVVMTNHSSLRYFRLLMKCFLQDSWQLFIEF